MFRKKSAHLNVDLFDYSIMQFLSSNLASHYFALFFDQALMSFYEASTFSYRAQRWVERRGVIGVREDVEAAISQAGNFFGSLFNSNAQVQAPAAPNNGQSEPALRNKR